MFKKVLTEFRKTAISTRDLGDKFEKLMLEYLNTDPLYKNKYSDIWLWMDWPDRKGRPDTGIDLVAREHDGEYCAIQCKCYEPSHSIQKDDIDSFFTESGKKPFTKRLIIATTNKWGKHADASLKNQHIPINRIGLVDLENSPIDWDKFLENNILTLKNQKQPRNHQEIAITKVVADFKEAERGMLIMACGTGKTFTALKIAEKMAANNGYVLFLVPSISLLSQTLREWSAEAKQPMNSFAVCSDTKVGKKNEDINSYDLAFSPTTDANALFKQVSSIKNMQTTKPDRFPKPVRFDTGKFTVIFSTYQSIKTISDAQVKGLPEFDLIICDEAHRTTGVKLKDYDESHFVRVHNQDFIKAKKRLYMTATPRIYQEAVKTKADEHAAELWSMDDASVYGQTFHKLGFSDAVSNNLLSDYKVMILAVDKGVSVAFQNLIPEGATLDERDKLLGNIAKIIGCWNGLSKRMAATNEDETIDLSPMRRAVAFSNSIKDSKQITDLFADIVNEYRKAHGDEGVLNCATKHVDGTFNALERNELLSWLKRQPQENTCNILSNARCLSEGIDVPALDAVMFLNPRNSIIDVVQSVGRVMRKAEGKKYGYIILPVVISAAEKPEDVLDNKKEYAIIWKVLQALRAHDDRFNAEINKIELNKAVPNNIQMAALGKPDNAAFNPIQLELLPNIEEWRNAILAKIVIKCGEKKYWENWAKDIAQIAERHITRIKALLEGSEPKHKATFDDFLKGLKKNLNPAINEADAIEMLSQHLITSPVFDALFENYSFAKHNPVSIAMQNMLDLLEEQALDKETATLDKFYDSVKMRAKGIDNAEGKQKIIIELYDKFFKTAFPRMSERLGIVYTPVEVVDFIVKSADEALQQEFGVGLTDENVHVLDPFTGTGTFIVRLLQSGLIKPEDLKRKYENELHANEIVLLAYYIAAVNIEAAFHGLDKGDYQPFNGIVLTDTFQMTEGKGYMKGYEDTMLPKNSERAKKQLGQAIQVIIGNPPYSEGQSENDNNKNVAYPQSDKRIRETYAEHSVSVNKNSLYDSYVRAIRWASDRIKGKGIICYVSNGSFIDGNNMDGLRKCLTDEFSSIYVFNLRGNGRTSGETCRKEGHPLFAATGGKGGSLTTIAISLLIKNPEKTGQCKLFYKDIGDYLSREKKLNIIKDFSGVSGIEWTQIEPNDSHDWINQRDPAFDRFISLGNKKDKTAKTIFDNYSLGIGTNRDAWCYNFSQEAVSANINRMINFYNEQVKTYQVLGSKKPNIEKFIETDPKKISWSSSLKSKLEKCLIIEYQETNISQSIYRPFEKQWLYFDRYLNHRVAQMPKIVPNNILKNISISVSGIGAQKDFSVLITNCIPDVHLEHNGQCFPLHTYEKQEDKGGLFNNSDEYVKQENIPDSILKEFRKVYKKPKITKDDIFYYVYGILHSPEYKTRFASDLKKMLPKIPYAKDFNAFSKAGCKLAQWHLNYETIEPYPVQESTSDLATEPKEFYRVQKMKFAGKAREPDKTTIIYNSKVTLTGIPLEAYDYIVNGKSAIEWIMERYQVTTDKKSGIKNNPNDWSEDPRYIVDLVKRIVRVSIETMKIVDKLPGLEEI